MFEWKIFGCFGGLWLVLKGWFVMFFVVFFEMWVWIMCLNFLMNRFLLLLVWSRCFFSRLSFGMRERFILLMVLNNMDSVFGIGDLKYFFRVSSNRGCGVKCKYVCCENLFG